MARYDRLIAFLEREAEALRHRMDGLAQREPPEGTPPGWADPVPDITDAKAMERLEEIEGHLRDLRADADPTWRPSVAGEAE